VKTKIILTLLIVGFLILLTGFKKNEQIDQLPSKQTNTEWKAVKIIIEDTVDKHLHEYVISLGSTFVIPMTNYRIIVLSFVPDFMVWNMPAAKIIIMETVMEEEREIWKGWLFSKIPERYPPLQRIRIRLIEGISQ
jgi:MFS superfamily sulfate permease-like transporter